mmetsp:Transcript_9056/g.29991  ORF Transcript_9056/g.29991 Transcript_9056/m.29991 type:complete len:263 (-) Transcript_9056:2106-2894(-)
MDGPCPAALCPTTLEGRRACELHLEGARLLLCGGRVSFRVPRYHLRAPAQVTLAGSGPLGRGRWLGFLFLIRVSVTLLPRPLLKPALFNSPHILVFLRRGEAAVTTRSTGNPTGATRREAPRWHAVHRRSGRMPQGGDGLLIVLVEVLCGECNILGVETPPVVHSLPRQRAVLRRVPSHALWIANDNKRHVPHTEAVARARVDLDVSHWGLHGQQSIPGLPENLHGRLTEGHSGKVAIQVAARDVTLEAGNVLRNLQAIRVW